MLPSLNPRKRAGVRSLTRSRLEDNQDSYRDESENESYIHKINDTSIISSNLWKSQTDIDAGYNTDEREALK